jgi:hypothetical protein
VPFGRSRESRSREVAGRRNWPEQWPRKCVAEKGQPTGLSKNRHEGSVHVNETERRKVGNGCVVKGGT